ncbi:MAG: RloB domain-containing protein [Lachnospiraceae bacterium]|nr:RloB domain-containing protein [Lachnospiraceae bacterium]
MRKRNRGKEVKGKKTKDKPKCTIYIFCEGQTERIYLEHFENKIYNVSIVPVDTKHTDAVGIVKFAKSYVSKIDMDLELGDRGYCVFDSDPASNPDINEAFAILKDCGHKGLYCIFSNPSFEVWFALHFENAPYGLSADKMKKHVKRLLKDKYPNYSETVDIYDYLLDRQEEALKRAVLLHRAQKQVHETVYSHQCNPYTDIFLFLEYMKKIKGSGCTV